ncbi:MAG: hypothetical protein HQL98_02810 [Magnetococcales bacterium]|nr:hypothetical protein [Magnetococcales bacterium]
MIRFIFSVLILLPIHPATGDEKPECLTCHQEKTPALLASWKQGRHGQAKVGCSDCHGALHDGKMAQRSRSNGVCLPCHEKESKSYRLSKHGVITTLEADRLDFSLPLKEGNLRAPTCAYCHLHDSHHAGIPPSDHQTPCRDCHSPRLVTTWFASGAEMVRTGEMKRREAQSVVDKIRASHPESIQPALALLKEMKENHLRNIMLGVGHQSPDDLWWHGQPALDGDLLRIKSLWGE